MKLPLDAEMLIPHRKPMCSIDSLVFYDGKSAIASACLSKENFFVLNEEGKIEQLILLELLAQAYAASKGYEDLLEGNQNLIIKVSSDEAFDNFHFAQGQVWHDEIMLMEAILKIWLSSEDDKKA